MIMRIWTTRIHSDREPDYRAFVNSRSRAMFRSQPGCLGVVFLHGDDDEFGACSFWRNVADIEALAASPSYQETVAALHATGILLGEANVHVYEVHGSVAGAALLEFIANEENT